MKTDPYTGLKGHPLWRVVDKAIGDLVENQDLDERTARKYVVGYLTKQILASGVVAPASKIVALNVKSKGRIRVPHPPTSLAS